MQENEALQRMNVMIIVNWWMGRRQSSNGMHCFVTWATNIFVHFVGYIL